MTLQITNIDCSTLAPGTICITQGGFEVEYIGKETMSSKEWYIFFGNAFATILYHKNGMEHHGTKEFMLICIKKPKLVLDCWVNVYKDDFSSYYSHVDKKTANLAGRSTYGRRRACVHVIQEYEEGEGL